jgi:hypothetical protein
MKPPAPHTPESADLLSRMEQWRRLAVIGNPLINADHVRTVCEEVVRRAQLIAQQHASLRPLDIAVFLLERSQAWLMAGTPIGEIGRKLPKTMSDLGVLKMSEGSDEVMGAPLTGRELKAVAQASRKIIQ